MSDNATSLYQVKQIRLLEELALQKLEIRVENLMERAGKSAFMELRKRWPKARNITVVCGKGNNGGDGYVIARLAKRAGLKVKILPIVPTEELSGAAAANAVKCQKLKIKTVPFSDQALVESDLIVDAILGTGLTGVVRGKFKIAIEKINATKIPVLALDLPSGVDADTGNILGVAIRASATITFLGLKIGLLIGEARNYTGELVSSDLDVSQKIFQLVEAGVQKLDLSQELPSLLPRKRTAHKGEFGHVLVIGGDYGMSGAVRMAAEAALRVGAGLVSVATRPEHAFLINGMRPEIMVYGINTEQQLSQLLAKASIVIVGPGLGNSSWSQELFNFAVRARKPLVVDADGLNILAANSQSRADWILTPHPGEAARLLGISNQEVQANRLTAVEKLLAALGGVCVLKGAGTLVAAADAKVRVCDAGNPGMASPGMGDVLSGIIGGLAAQGLTLFDAAKLGVLVHATAGDRVAAKCGEVGILALDLLPEVRAIINNKKLK